MRRLKKTSFVGFLILSSIFILIFTFFPYSAINDKDTYEWSDSVFIKYNHYYAVNSSSDDYINWDIHSTVRKVGIIVLAIEKSDYFEFKTEVIARGLSATTYGGNYDILYYGMDNIAAGSYRVPYYNNWYIVFVNVDSYISTTYLNFDVEWNLCYLYDFSSIKGLLLNPLIVLGVFLFILIRIAYAVDSASRKKRKFVITEQNNSHRDNQLEALQISNPIPKNTKSYNQKLERLANQVSNLKLLTQKLTNKNFYCIYCGEKLTQESTQAYNMLIHNS